MLKNDIYALLIVLVGSTAFITGLVIQNVWLTIPGLISLLIGAGAYRGVK